MGNNCVGSRVSRDGFFQSISNSTWWSRSPDCMFSHTNRQINCETPSITKEFEAPLPVQNKPPEQVKIVKEEIKPAQPAKPKKPQYFKRVSSVGLHAESVLRTKTGHLKEYYNLGRKLGHGQFGTTFLCVEKATGKEYACKSIAKRKLVTKDDVDDVRREIQIMHHLAGHPNVISIKGAYEDTVAVHVVMELCTGGELFDRIVKRGHYTERKAAQLARTIVSVVEACHSLGVMHRDLKPENFLFVNEQEDSPLKTIDFGLSIFFKPGETFSDVVGSPYYVAPEVLRKFYGPEADVWSAGVIIYILLSGVPPFWAETEQEIFEEVLHGDLDFSSDPWPNISESAKDLVRKMLVRDPKKRLTAHEVLCHPWVQVDEMAPDKPLDSAVLSRLKQFSAMNKLKKMALRVIAESLSEEEIGGLKEMFKMIDTDNSGQITYEELKAGLKRFGANLNESEIYDLMQAADVDNSGTIDYGEFIAATLHLNKVEREDHLFAAFSYFDKDGSGYITQDELQEACEEFGIEDIHLEEMIQEVDQDNDGRIDYNEFVAMMQKGNADFGNKGLQNSFSIGFREALQINKVTEMSLFANQGRAEKENERLVWKVEDSGDEKPKVLRGGLVNPAKLVVELAPLEIHTFIIDFNYKWPTTGRFLHLILYTAERAWSHAMEKRQLPDCPNARQRSYLIGQLRKAVKWATLFALLCAIKGDSITSLEAELCLYDSVILSCICCDYCVSYLLVIPIHIIFLVLLIFLLPF